MEHADLRNRDDAATWRGLHDSWLGTVVVERLMGPRVRYFTWQPPARLRRQGKRPAEGRQSQPTWHIKWLACGSPRSGWPRPWISRRRRSSGVPRES